MDIAVVGAGTIGLSWVRRFVAGGHRVRVSDPRPDLAEAVAALGLGEGVRAVGSAEEALDGADLVQESGPESLPFKQGLVATFGQVAPSHALYASSSSALLPTHLAAQAPDAVAARVLVGHPFNPPHLMPRVEVVPGERTAETTVEAARAFYAALGMEPAVLHREVPGFVGNRLQKALWVEGFRLVQEGVVSVEDLDTVIKNSLGLRLACVGLAEAAQMGGGAQGIRGLLSLLSESMAQVHLASEPDWSDEAMAEVYRQADEAYGSPVRPALVTRRDAALAAVMEARAQL